MTSLVLANNWESLTIRQSLTENESEWLNCFAETAVFLLPKSLFYFELASETKRNSLSEFSNFASAAVL